MIARGGVPFHRVSEVWSGEGPGADRVPARERAELDVAVRARAEEDQAGLLRRPGLLRGLAELGAAAAQAAFEAVRRRLAVRIELEVELAGLERAGLDLDGQVG